MQNTLTRWWFQRGSQLNYQPKQCTYYGQITQNYRTFTLFDSSEDEYFNDPCFNQNWNQPSNWIISPSRGNKTHLKTPPLSLHLAPVLSKSLVLKKATLSSSFVFSFDINVAALPHLLFSESNYGSAECTWEYSRQLTLKLGTYVSKTTPLWSSSWDWSTQSGTCELEN